MKPTIINIMIEKTPEGDLDQSRYIGVVTEERLQKPRQRRAGGIEDGVRTKDDEADAAKLRCQRTEVDDRIGDPKLPEDQDEKADCEREEQRLHAPERVVIPVPFLAFAEHDFPART